MDNHIAWFHNELVMYHLGGKIQVTTGVYASTYFMCTKKYYLLCDHHMGAKVDFRTNR